MAPWKSLRSALLPLLAKAAQAATTVSVSMSHASRATGRLLTHAHVAFSVAPVCKLRGTNKYDLLDCNQHSADTDSRQRMFALEVAAPTVPGLIEILPVDLGSLSCSKTKHMHARGSNNPSNNGPDRARSSGCTRLNEHSVTSKASNVQALQGNALLCKVAGSRASHQ